MARIRIWDTRPLDTDPASPRDAIRDLRSDPTRPGGWTVREFDSAKRTDESDVEWRLRMLLRDLQCLAAEPEILLQAFWFPGPNYIPDSIAEDFGWHVELAQQCVKGGLVSSEVFDQVLAVDVKLDEMSGEQNALLWTDDAVRASKEWAVVRRLAREALKAMTYDLEPPPPWWKTQIVELTDR